MFVADQNEDARISALKQLEVLDTQPEAQFDGFVKVAASVCGTPISLITLVDNDRQWFKANIGFEQVNETPREVAFCTHTIENEGIFEVNDAATDSRFEDNPLVRGAPHIRFYAGVPLRLKNGAQVGSLCVIDKKPNQLTAQQRETLHHLSVAVVEALEARRLTRFLAASEARFRALSAAAPLGIFSTDDNGACTYANERWQSIFNVSPADTIGYDWRDSIHPDDRQDVFAELQAAAISKCEFDMEFRIQHSDGNVVDVRAITRPIETSDGTLCGHVGSVENVRDRLVVQRVLSEERRRLNSIIEGTRAGTWEWNIQSGEMRFNFRWAEMLGRTLHELEPSTIQMWYELAHPEDIVFADRLLDQHLIGEIDVYECELRFRHREGHWVWVHLRGRVITSMENGQPEWMFGTQLDITKRKTQEHELRKSEWLLTATGALADVGGWELDLAMNRVHWTTQTCRIHGVAENYHPQLEEAVEFFTPEARPVFRGVIERAINEGQQWDIELPLEQACGKAIWVRSVGYVEYDHDKPVRIIGAFQNITDRVLQRLALESAHERIKVATESGKIGVWDWNIQTGTLEWTQQMFELYGLVPDSLNTSYDMWVQRVHAEDRAAAEMTVQNAIHAGTGLDTEFRVQLPDGSVRYIRATANITRSDDGTARRMLGVNWDVTHLRTLSNQLAEQHELLHVTLQSIGDAVITSDVNGIVTWLNPVAQHMTGWLSEEAQGIPLEQVFNIVHEKTREPLENPVKPCLKSGMVSGPSGQTVLISRNGIEFGIEDSAAPIRSNGNELLGVVLVFRDVTERRRLTNEMSYRATHDALTGLINRSEFETRLQASLDKAMTGKREHALMFIDLDQFKLVNDACGHSEGDQLLVQIARLLSKAIRKGDTLARLGGDEFGVILEDCTSAQAETIAQQICNSMDVFRFEHEERRFRIGTSIGLVPLDSRWTNIESAMQAADASCFTAKEAGRNRVHIWFDTDRAMRTRRKDMQWATRLELALDEENFVLYAQSIMHLSSRNSGLHAEVLIRLLDTDGTLIPPKAFLPAAERFNLASRIDRWTLKTSLNMLVNSADRQTTKMLCINLSGQSVGDRVFHKDAIDLLKNSGDDICRRICLEVTETAVVTNVADATDFIEQVRELGVRVALDDFGSGASSFGYLKSLPVDILKIDGQFIQNVIENPLDTAAVRCFVDIARVTNLQTVAECVESQEVLDYLAEIGVDSAQGFYMHRPEPLQQVLNAVRHTQKTGA